MGEFNYVNRTYGLSLKRGSRCIYTGDGRPREGTVTSTDGAYINIRFDDAPRKVAGPFHPTWEMQHNLLPPPPVLP